MSYKCLSFDLNISKPVDSIKEVLHSSKYKEGISSLMLSICQM
nr:MAG TPA: hypothetical protein [Caudoviricetes sp.]